jgi:hypothetical protein
MDYHRFNKIVRSAIAPRMVPNRWWYAPFLFGVGLIGILAMHNGLGDAWPYLVLILVFSGQTLRPTVLGWWCAVFSWLLLCFLSPLYSRVVDGMSNFTIEFLLLWGIVPLIALVLLRPRRAVQTPVDSMPITADPGNAR